MGMSTHVIGFRPPDDRWRQMKAVWDACEVAGLAVPPDVERFFGGEEPDPRGVEVDIPATRWSDETREGYEVAVADIPEGVTVLRFYNLY